MKSSGKSEYVLSNAISIKDEISKYISNIKHIFKDDKEEADFILQKILSSYTESWIRENISERLFKNYYTLLEVKDYNNLLEATGMLTYIIQNRHPLIDKEVNQIREKILNHTIENPSPLSTYRSQIQHTAIHELIILSELPADEIKELGEVYENFL